MLLIVFCSKFDIEEEADPGTLGEDAPLGVGVVLVLPPDGSCKSQTPSTRWPGGLRESQDTRNPDMTGKRLKFRRERRSHRECRRASPFLRWPRLQGRFQCRPDCLAVQLEHDDRIFEWQDLEDIAERDHPLETSLRVRTDRQISGLTGTVYRVPTQCSCADEHPISPTTSLQTQGVVVGVTQDVREPVCCCSLTES